MLLEGRKKKSHAGLFPYEYVGALQKITRLVLRLSNVRIPSLSILLDFYRVT